MPASSVLNNNTATTTTTTASTTQTSSTTSHNGCQNGASSGSTSSSTSRTPSTSSVPSGTTSALNSQFTYFESGPTSSSTANTSQSSSAATTNAESKYLSSSASSTSSSSSSTYIEDTLSYQFSNQIGLSTPNSYAKSVNGSKSIVIPSSASSASASGANNCNNNNNASSGSSSGLGSLVNNSGSTLEEMMALRGIKTSQNVTESVPVPSSEHVAEIVGRQGCKIKALRAKTNTYIKTPIRGETPMFVITGRKEDVQTAKREIQLAADHFSQIRARRGTSANSGSPSCSSNGATSCSSSSNNSSSSSTSSNHQPAATSIISAALLSSASQSISPSLRHTPTPPISVLNPNINKNDSSPKLNGLISSSLGSNSSSGSTGAGCSSSSSSSSSSVSPPSNLLNNIKLNDSHNRSSSTSPKNTTPTPAAVSSSSSSCSSSSNSSSSSSVPGVCSIDSTNHSALNHTSIESIGSLLDSSSSSTLITPPMSTDLTLTRNTAPTANLLPGQIVKKVSVPYQVVGLVVGPKGSTIKRIQQNTSTYIVTPSRDSQPVFEIQGMPDNVEAAKSEIENYILLRTTASSLNNQNVSIPGGATSAQSCTSNGNNQTQLGNNGHSVGSNGQIYSSSSSSTSSSCSSSNEFTNSILAANHHNQNQHHNHQFHQTNAYLNVNGLLPNGATQANGFISNEYDFYTNGIDIDDLKLPNISNLITKSKYLTQNSSSSPLSPQSNSIFQSVVSVCDEYTPHNQSNGGISCGGGGSGGSGAGKHLTSIWSPSTSASNLYNSLAGSTSSSSSSSTAGRTIASNEDFLVNSIQQSLNGIGGGGCIGLGNSSCSSGVTGVGVGNNNNNTNTRSSSSSSSSTSSSFSASSSSSVSSCSSSKPQSFDSNAEAAAAAAAAAVAASSFLFLNDSNNQLQLSNNNSCNNSSLNPSSNYDFGLITSDLDGSVHNGITNQLTSSCYTSNMDSHHLITNGNDVFFNSIAANLASSSLTAHNAAAAAAGMGINMGCPNGSILTNMVPFNSFNGSAGMGDVSSNLGYSISSSLSTSSSSSTSTSQNDIALDSIFQHEHLLLNSNNNNNINNGNQLTNNLIDPLMRQPHEFNYFYSPSSTSNQNANNSSNNYVNFLNTLSSSSSTVNSSDQSHLNNNHQCIICVKQFDSMINPNVMILPCRHACYCSSCAQDLVNMADHCRLCGMGVTQAIRI